MNQSPAQVRTIILSHIEDLSFLTGKEYNSRKNFIKYLVMKYTDISEIVSPAAVYSDFIQEFPNFKI